MIIVSMVSLVRVKQDDEQGIFEAVRRSLEIIGGIDDIVNPGDLVLINPNLVAVPAGRLSGAITRWEVCKAIADLVKEKGGRPVIAESSAAGVDTEKVIEAGEYAQLRERGYEVVDLKPTPPAKIPVPEGHKVFSELGSWELVQKADVIISVPVMKTHDQTEVTLSMKNLKGLIDDAQKKAFHKNGLLEGVVDLMTALKPSLTVFDATVCQEGMGPIFGTPVPMGLILASKDLVAADAVGGRIMGYEPKDVMITVRAAFRGIGEMDLEKIEVRGDATISEVERRFKRSSETIMEGVPPFELMMDEGACTGCRNTVISAIMDLKDQSLEGNLEGKYVIAGPLNENLLPPGAEKENTILVGICTKHLENRGTYVQGCPPNNIFVVRAVVGEGQKIERRYATEEGADDQAKEALLKGKRRGKNEGSCCH
ncbi:MAG: DUF362 domain-containing protein [Thermovirgaceae bacterium]|nr:DUF362 domain-containing protein [Thermovirgaceae bacterium]